MQLSSPIEISSSLKPCVRIGEDSVCIGYADRPGDDGRTRYRWQILIGPKEYTGDDMQSGCGGGSLRSGLESLLSFLGACGESYPDGENAGLFPDPIPEWCYQNSDELGMAAYEVEETPGCIVE